MRLETDKKIWQFIAEQLRARRSVALLQVVESIGSSPGRVGFRMAVTISKALDSQLFMGSIGGGIMEQKLVALAAARLREGRNDPFLKRQIHRKNAAYDQSGMICSGEQTVLFYTFKADDLLVVEHIITDLSQNTEGVFLLSETGVSYNANKADLATLKILPNLPNFFTTYWQQGVYVEKIGVKNHLYLIGAGHCALALSRQMRLLADFKIHLFDDRPNLNTFLENESAHEKTVVDYRQMPDLVPEGDHIYVVLMTVGYRSDAQILRGLRTKKLKYLGMLGSRTKVATLRKDLQNDGFDVGFLEKIHAPIGLDIKSQTPEEIAVSIAAQIIRVKNG